MPLFMFYVLYYAISSPLLCYYQYHVIKTDISNAVQFTYHAIQSHVEK